MFVNSGVVWCDMQAKSVCICTYDGIKVGWLQQCRLCDVKSNV